MLRFAEIKERMRGAFLNLRATDWQGTAPSPISFPVRPILCQDGGDIMVSLG